MGTRLPKFRENKTLCREILYGRRDEFDPFMSAVFHHWVVPAKQRPAILKQSETLRFRAMQNALRQWAYPTKGRRDLNATPA
jgi:hypothetical protein